MRRGHIMKRAGQKDGYTIVLDLGKDPITGKRKRKWVAVKGDSKAAEKKLTELLRDLDTGLFVDADKTPLKRYLDLWLEDSVKPNLSPRTYETYYYMCNKYIIPAIGHIQLKNLKPQHLTHLYSAQKQNGLSAASIQLMHITLHKALKNAARTGLLVRNIAELVEAPKIQRHEFNPMDEIQVRTVLEAAKETPYYALFFTAIFSGMRRNELLALRWSDVDLDLMKISVNRSMQKLQYSKPDESISFKEPKSAKSRRMIDLTPGNAVVLREHRKELDKQRKELNLAAVADKDLIFGHYDGKPFLPNCITDAWRKLVKDCGLKGVRFHDARHTMASLMLKNGVHPKIVQERLGHSGIAITLNLYSHVAPGLQAAAASKLDDLVFNKPTKLEKELKEITG